MRGIGGNNNMQKLKDFNNAVVTIIENIRKYQQHRKNIQYLWNPCNKAGTSQSRHLRLKTRQYMQELWFLFTMQKHRKIKRIV